MSSTSNESSTPDPLPEGSYFLVDISEAVAPYLSLPIEVRMAGVGDAACYTATDMLDIELSAVVPCLDGDQTAPREMKEHIENLLDDGREMVAEMLRNDGIDTERRTIMNTADQLDHARAVDKMAKKLHEIFHEHKLYNEGGMLIGEHCTVLDGNVLVLRET